MPRYARHSSVKAAYSQRKCRRTTLLNGMRRRNDIKPVLRQLHWLLVRRRIGFKVVCLVHQSLSGQAPGYLADDCRLVSETGRRALQSANIMTVRCRGHKSYGDSGFAAAGRVCVTNCNNCRHFYSDNERTALCDRSICSALEVYLLTYLLTYLHVCCDWFSCWVVIKSDRNFCWES